MSLTQFQNDSKVGTKLAKKSYKIEGQRALVHGINCENHPYYHTIIRADYNN